MAIFNGTAAGDTLNGGADDDTLNGLAGDDVFYGNSGNDTLNGGDGNDQLFGGPGNDILDGGAGVLDYARYDHAGGAVNVNLALGTSSGADGVDQFLNLEGVVGSAFDDTLVGSANNDFIEGGTGNDRLDGGLGVDYLGHQLALGAVTVNLALGTTAGVAGSDVLLNFENVGGSPFNDLLTGNAGNNILEGMLGDDLLDGGDGRDGASYYHAAGGVTVRLSTATAAGDANGADGHDVLTNFEDIYGSLFADTLIGNAGNNAILGYSGDDVIDGKGGADTLTGGAGRDQFTLYQTVLTIADFEAGANADALDVSLLLAYSATGGGYDIYSDPFATGYLRVQQSGGNTSVEWDPDGKTVPDPYGGSEPRVWQTVAVLQNVQSATLVRQNYSGIAIVGTDRDDTLVGDIWVDLMIGGLGNDLLDGGVGADRMEGGRGADTYYVDNLADVVLEVDNALGFAPDPRPGLDLGGAIDSVVSSVSFSLGDYVENLTLAVAAGNLLGTGNALDNVLVGNEGNNSFTGAGGNDSIDGAAGLDVAMYSGKRADFSLAKTSTVLTLTDNSGSEGRDTLTGIERLHFSDSKIAYDMDGHAGQTAKLLGAVFGVASVGNKQLVGIGLQLLDGGMSYEQLAGLAVAAAGKTSHADVVSLLWTNLVGVAPTTAQAAPVVALLDGGVSVGELTVVVAELSLNTENINLVGLAQSGLEFMS
jgi:Ca2+-binding RTX toxin-like protein